MLKGFTKFVNTNQSVSPAVSYYEKTGRFTFNQPAVKEYKLHEYKYCWLYYDPKTNRIGFEFITTPENGACRVANYNHSFHVAGYSFVKYFGLEVGNLSMAKLEFNGNNFFFIQI